MKLKNYHKKFLKFLEHRQMYAIGIHYENEKKSQLQMTQYKTIFVESPAYIPIINKHAKF